EHGRADDRGRLVLQFFARELCRSSRAGVARRERRRDSEVVLRKGTPAQRGRHRGLERVCLETWLARFHVAAVPKIKGRARMRRSRRYRVCSRFDGFRRRTKKLRSSGRLRGDRIADTM